MKASFPFPLAPDTILHKRAEILARLLAADEAFSRIPICGISQKTLDMLLAMYDASFLNGVLKCVNIRITLSPRLTSSAGKFVYTRGVFGRIKTTEIRMSGDFLLRLNQGPFELNGLTVATPQEAFLLVFEHELCHAAETVLYGKTGHSSRFLHLANGLFGHTATRHRLPTRRHEAAQNGLLVGMGVSFSYKGGTLTGTVTYIGKMATVMVPSSQGEYRDRRGRRYTKYRVPLDHLTIC